mmetsp:Transcript_27298/g.64081  ORF Transcript_27298/g.64081 Transcript_27298/m.64081 type:complete len:219 (-) Transcript_27298:844-1500(-)
MRVPAAGSHGAGSFAAGAGGAAGGAGSSSASVISASFFSSSAPPSAAAASSSFFSSASGRPAVNRSAASFSSLSIFAFLAGSNPALHASSQNSYTSNVVGNVTARMIFALFPPPSGPVFCFQKNRTSCTLSTFGRDANLLSPLYSTSLASASERSSRSSASATLNPSERWFTLIVMLHLNEYSLARSSRVSPVSSQRRDLDNSNPNNASTAGTSRQSV